MVGQNLGLPVLPAQWFFIVPPALFFSRSRSRPAAGAGARAFLIFALASLVFLPERAIAVTPQLLFCLPCFTEGGNVEPRKFQT
jgi:hypothetical protein